MHARGGRIVRSGNSGTSMVPARMPDRPTAQPAPSAARRFAARASRRHRDRCPDGLAPLVKPLARRAPADLAGSAFAFSGNGKRCRGFEVAVKLFDGPFPAVAFIGDQALQHRQDRRLGILRGRLEFDRTGEGRNPIEGCFLGEMSPDLGIRIHSRLQAAEQLQYEAVTVDNRRIALFCCAAPYGQRRLGRSKNLLKDLPWHTPNDAAVACAQLACRFQSARATPGIRCRPALHRAAGRPTFPIRPRQ